MAIRTPRELEDKLGTAGSVTTTSGKLAASQTGGIGKFSRKRKSEAAKPMTPPLSVAGWPLGLVNLTLR